MYKRQDQDYALAFARALSGQHFRAYASTDVTGVEVGGATKNVLAIGAGISDGLGFGANTRVALITRGLAEMMRLGVALGALEREGEFGRQPLDRSHVFHPPGIDRREIGGEIRHDAEEIGEFLTLAPGQIVGREEVQGHHLDATLLAPPEKLGNFPGTGAMADRCALLQTLLRPAPVAVDDHGDVMRHSRSVDLTPQAPLIQPVQQPGPW